jgi:hypothetical protein
MASILPPQAAWLQVCGDAKLSFKSRNQVRDGMALELEAGRAFEPIINFQGVDAAGLLLNKSS